jgi:hypothetical protein
VFNWKSGRGLWRVRGQLEVEDLLTSCGRRCTLRLAGLALLLLTWLPRAVLVIGMLT